MTRMSSLLFTLLWLAATPALAVLPENGLYFNPQQPDLSYNIQVQGSTLTMRTYAHTRSGDKPVVYFATGPIQSANAASFLYPWWHEYAYQFNADLYRTESGPCVTCFWPDWSLSENSTIAGQVSMRLTDANRIFATFTMNDGSSRSVTLLRLGFGRAGYDLGRADGRILPDLRGDWIFVDAADPEAPVWRFQFSKVEAPVPVTDADFRFYGNKVPSLMRFVDPEANATLTCTRAGCGLVQDDTALFLIKFVDIGMDSMLGYKGQRLYPDDYSKTGNYRTGALVIGKHVVDPTPAANAVPETCDTGETDWFYPYPCS